jgi:hypothetical protein
MRSRLVLCGDEFVTHLLDWLRHSFTTAFCESNQGLAFLDISLHVMLSPILPSSNHKSTELACIIV